MSLNKTFPSFLPSFVRSFVRSFTDRLDGLHDGRLAVVVPADPVGVGAVGQGLEHDGQVARLRGLVQQHVGVEPAHVLPRGRPLAVIPVVRLRRRVLRTLEVQTCTESGKCDSSRYLPKSRPVQRVENVTVVDNSQSVDLYRELKM